MRTLRALKARVGVGSTFKLLLAFTDDGGGGGVEREKRITLRIWDGEGVYGGDVVQPAGGREWAAHFRDTFQSAGGAPAPGDGQCTRAISFQIFLLLASSLSPIACFLTPGSLPAHLSAVARLVCV